MLHALLALAVTGCGGGGGEDDPAPPDGAPLTDAATSDAGAGLDAAPPDAGPDAFYPLDGFLDAAVDAGPPVPERIWVGVNDIQEDMLGAEPGTFEGRRSTFRWTLPPEGWTVEVHVPVGPEWERPTEMPYLLWRYVSIVHDPVVIRADDVRPRGGRWDEVRGGIIWRARIATPPASDPGDYTLQAKVEDFVSPPLALSIGVLTPEADPFDQIDHWVVTFSRDSSTLRVEHGAGGYAVATDDEVDGVPDFEEALEAVGLLGGDAAWREGVLERVRESFRGHLHGFFLLNERGEIEDDSVRIRVRLEGDPGVPAPEAWDAEGWSRIAVGGDDPEPQGGSTFFGRAALDWNNAGADDDTTPSRGIFTTSFLRFLLGNPVTGVLLADYTPSSGGDPFGSRPGDADFLEPGFDPDALPPGEQRTRASRFSLLIQYVPLALASVTAHEMGHSLGLVKPGFPPQGLLGGVAGPWVVEALDENHIDIQGANLMQSGRSFRLAEAFGSPPTFEPHSLAYLRRRLIVQP